MKAKTMSRLALLCAVLSLIVSLLTLFRPEPEDNSAEQLELLIQQNAELQSRMDDLQDQLGGITPSRTLADWEFRMAPRADASGAEITLAATPSSFEDDMAAYFIVRLGEEELAHVPCAWDGKALVATVDLEAADGYSYYCLLVNTDGSSQQYALTTVENPVDPIPVNLKSSMGSSCSISVDSFEANADTLMLTGGSLQAQLPKLSSDDVDILSAELIVSAEEEEVSRTPITLEYAGSYGSYILTLSDLTLPLEGADEAQSVVLTLEVSLSNGSTLQAHTELTVND